MSKFSMDQNKIIISALAILLCLSSVVGATFALFTYDLGDGKIGINTTAGKLKVDIVDEVNDEQSMVGDVLDFQTTSTHRDVLFEPGATFYTEGFRVKNAGNIRMNFILYVSEDPSLALDFEEAFEVWITTDPKNLSNAEKLQDYTGTLEAGHITDVYYLVFRMKTDADNRFQKRTFSGVGITVCAIQGNATMN